MATYTGTNDLNQIVTTNPPASGTVAADLGPAELETRRVMVAVIEKEHNSDGTHKSVNGAVLVAGSVPSTALAGSGLTDTQIQALGITAASLALLTVTAAQIANNTITGGKIATKTIPVGCMLGTTTGSIWVVQAGGGLAEVAISGGATLSASGVLTIPPASSNQAIAIFADIKASGTDGGTLTSGSWQVRELNSTVIDSAMLFNLSANVLSWSRAGTYYIKAEALGHKVDLHQIRLYDNTNNVVIADGTASCAAAAGTDQTLSTAEAVLVITAAQTMVLQHQCGTTAAGDGCGKSTGFGDNNVMARITIIKLA